MDDYCLSPQDKGWLRLWLAACDNVSSEDPSEPVYPPPRMSRSLYQALCLIAED